MSNGKKEYRPVLRMILPSKSSCSDTCNPSSNKHDALSIFSVNVVPSSSTSENRNATSVNFHSTSYTHKNPTWQT
eukprot:6375311-Amphidinium_carterae.1